MNRQLLFRGKRVDNGEWVEGDLIHKQVWKCSLTIIRISDDGFDHYEEFEVIPETVGEFTDLTDKNGNKIFEGDVVSYEDCPASDYYRETIIVNCGAIEFSDGMFYVTERETVEMDDLVYNGTMECDVIGNIYDKDE